MIRYAALTALIACGGKPAPAPPGQPLALSGLSLTVPQAWSARPLTSKMRVAQYELPGAGGAAAADLTVYHFGAQGAGSIDANLDRWYSQFEQPDGRPSRDAAAVERFEVDGVPITLVDVSGRYVAQTTPGSAERHDDPDFRMLAAIADAGGGAYYFKLVGPQATVARWRDPFVAALRTLKRSGSGPAPPPR
jgi:hypothetical protein